MDMKSVPNPVDAAGPIKATLSNLFYGWGYNFYRKENQLRSDDLLIREKISNLLGEARSHLAGLESAYRRDHLPPPSREHPFPDAAALQTVRSLENLIKDIEQLEVKIRTAAVPEMDRIHQRHRIEWDTLERLGAVDLELVSGVMAFQQAVLKLSDAPTAASQGAELLKQAQIDADWRLRESILSPLG
jgi:hypothetical protein